MVGLVGHGQLRGGPRVSARAGRSERADEDVERAAEALGREVAADEKLVVEPPGPNEPLAPTRLGMDGTGVPEDASLTS